MEAVENIIETPAAQRGKLLKILGVTFGIAVTIGGMIGLGILRTPGAVAGQLGSLWLILGIWILGGLYAILGTIAVAELSTSLPMAGGWYVYARRAFGDYGGFVVGWSDWLSSCAMIAFVAITIGEYLPKLFPAYFRRHQYHRFDGAFDLRTFKLARFARRQPYSGSDQFCQSLCFFDPDRRLFYLRRTTRCQCGTNGFDY